MAFTMSDKFLSALNDQVCLNMERRMMLDAMEEGVIKDWITILLAENKRLDDDLCKAMRKLGNNGFNPVHLDD